MSKSIDLAFLTSFTGGNSDKMKKYINMFLGFCPGQLKTMKEHLEAGNYDGLRGSAHALKPQITYMGIKAGEDLVKKIESNASSKTDVEKLPEMLSTFTSICEQAMAELKEEVMAG
jgi:HPt (histidine-containing phosphotransfer) domain-containing protein